jgi:hypothetical protein
VAIEELARALNDLPSNLDAVAGGIGHGSSSMNLPEV